MRYASSAFVLLAALALQVPQARAVPMEFVGVQDVFGESGDAFELMEKYGLTASKVAEAAQRVVKRRGR